MKYCTRY
nr:unnamed protein product [Callosobruchus chinensis]